jgi:hypothetical protein
MSFCRHPHRLNSIEKTKEERQRVEIQIKVAMSLQKRAKK